MRFHFATVPVHGSAEAQRELNTFLGSHRVLGVERHLITDGAQSTWAICVSYTDRSAQPASTHPTAAFDPAMVGRTGPGRKERVDYREVLSDAEFAAFLQLREWRKHTAERDGVPPYAVFTNEQLAEIARRRTQTVAALAGIDGVGAARVEKYGAAVLELLKATPPATPTSPGPAHSPARPSAEPEV